MEHGKHPPSRDKLYGFREGDLQWPKGTQEATALFPMVEQSVSMLAMSGVDGYIQDGRGFVGLDMQVIQDTHPQVQQLTDLLVSIDFESNPNPTGYKYGSSEEISVEDAVTDIMQKIDGLEEEDLQDIDNDDDYDDSVVNW